MRIVSGIQPSGKIHLGNYLGAIKNWLSLQKENECFFFLADLHALTLPQNPQILKENIFQTLATLLACGLSPEKNIIYLQSEIEETTELCWILSSFCKIPELQRMHHFKEKSKEKKEINMALFNYPVLMAADILIVKAEGVPVGEDQLQHLELTRSLARRFNKKFGKIFPLPKALLTPSKKIYALDNPLKKMSKSAQSKYNYIALDDTPDEIYLKIKRAVTDPGKEIKYDPQKKPGISNLLLIFSEITEKEIKDIENEFQGKGYKEFKEKLAEVLIEKLKPLREKIEKLKKDKSYLKEVLEKGKEKAKKITQDTLKEVKEKVGISII